MYPFSVRNCPGPERGGTADCYTVPFYSQYFYSELSKLFLSILSWDTPAELHSLLLSIDLWRIYYFYHTLYQTVTGHWFYHKYWICSFVVFMNTTFSQQWKQSITFNFRSTTTCAEHKFLLPKPSDHWRTEHYQESDNCWEVDLGSDINHLDSGNIWQYNTVPSQCEKFPWTWTWRLLHSNCWYYSEKRPGSVSSVICKKLPLQQGAFYSWKYHNPHNTRRIILYYLSTVNIATVSDQY